MKKYAILGLLTSVLLVSGCATEKYVHSQVDPLSDRMAKIETRLAATEAKLTQVQQGEMSTGDRAALQEARDTANRALELAKKAEADARAAGSEVRKSESAAKEAEMAAKEAEKAAKKSEKIFRLEQKK